MRLNSISFAALAVLATVVDCEAGRRWPTDGMFRSEGADFTLREEGGALRVDIPFIFVNETGRPVYIPSCNGPHPPVLEKFENRSWVVAYAPIVPLCLGQPVEIAPGQRYDYDYHVHAALPGTNGEPKFSVSPIAGSYRAVWSLYREKLSDGTVASLLPPESRTSNVFRIHGP